jgi:diguanylate cyclase (GGDEF)-like protein
MSGAETAHDHVRRSWWRRYRFGRVKLLGISLSTLLVFSLGVTLTVLRAKQLRDDVARSQSDRLAERAHQTTNLFSTITLGVTALMRTGAVVAETTSGDAAAFKRAVGPRLGPTLLSNAVLFDVSAGTVAERGWTGSSKPLLWRAPTARQVALLRYAAKTADLVVVAHGRRGGSNVIGIATAATPGSRYAVYAEVSVPKALSFGGLTGVWFAFYFGKEDTQSLLASNAPKLPLAGERLVVRLDTLGLSQTPILVYANRSSESGIAAIGPWLVLAFGVGLSLLLATQLEALMRRRDNAVSQAALNRHQALHDALTGLPNRTLFRGRIEQALSGKSRGSSAVILVDLDHFKEVNDTLGHHSGDLLLQALSRRLQHRVRLLDTVARLGGDEFGVFIESCASASDALAIADKIRGALRGPVEVSGLTIEVDASVGIALHPDHGKDVDTLMRHADIALYRSKVIHTPTIYAVEHDHYSPARLQLVSDLRQAIVDGQILVYYQPLAPAGPGPIHSVEALVRWQHPTLGLISPDQFIPLAEQTGTIRSLTRFVLETALGQCRAWLDRGHHINVAVNVCARDLLDAQFPDEVATCLQDAGVPPQMLELEITEDTIFTDSVRAFAVIARLHDRGVRFAIDDFGAGQSSFSYLKRLPIDVLKIDKSFVLGMNDNADDAAIVKSAINFGQNLRLTVVAEGVETHETRQQLAALGCDVIQGYHLARPLPPEAVERLFGVRIEARAVDDETRPGSKAA